MYSDEEREVLWLQKLDEEVRYVNGVKVDVSKGYDEYYKVLREARRMNTLLGYGDDSKNWDVLRYENGLRLAGQRLNDS